MRAYSGKSECIELTELNLEKGKGRRVIDIPFTSPEYEVAQPPADCFTQNDVL